MDLFSSALPDYAELFAFTNFSFLHGASHGEELVLPASQLGYAGLAITDECSLAGVVRAHVQAKEEKLPLIIGSYFRLVHADKSPAFGLILLAQNRNGYGNLSELITLGRMRAAKGEYLVTPHDLSKPEKEHAHLRGMPDCLAILVPDFPAKEDALSAQVEWLNETFPARAWVGLILHQRAMDDIHRGSVEYVAEQHRVPVVALGNVVMHMRSRKPLQDTMTAIRIGKPVAECGYDLAPNAEQHLRSRLRLANLYPAHALAQTLDILERCTFSLDELRYEYPDELVPDGFTHEAYLRQETYIGAHKRFPAGIPLEVQQQIEHELQLIREMRYEAYFLTVYDIVRFARSQHILCQGRGSAANSAVWYCLGVTEVDAKRHGVEVVPIDVTISGWDSVLERRVDRAKTVVRLGLSLLRGMRDGSAERIENARAVKPFASVSDLARRAQLDRHDLQVLAAANALQALAGNRREALWQSVAAVPDRDILADSRIDDETPELGAPSEAEDIVSDYNASGLTLGRHPLSLLRPTLLEQRLMPASTLRTYRNGRLARGCGLVTVRQRPGTAKGVMFVTLEDETGNVNVIIWPSLLEKQRREALGAALLAVYGTWQCEGEVRHLEAQRLVDMSHLLGGLTTVSRNFC